MVKIYFALIFGEPTLCIDVHIVVTFFWGNFLAGVFFENFSWEIFLYGLFETRFGWII